MRVCSITRVRATFNTFVVSSYIRMYRKFIGKGECYEEVETDVWKWQQSKGFSPEGLNAQLKR
jgi:hypothetical protein